MRNMLIAAVAALTMLATPALAGGTIALDEEKALNWHICVSAEHAIEATTTSVANVRLGSVVWATKVREGECGTLPQPTPITLREVLYESPFPATGGMLRVFRGEFTTRDGGTKDIWVIASDTLKENTSL